MPDTTLNARVWNGFVCPDCRHLFRVARDHDGRGVVCPGCQRMLRLPQPGDIVPELRTASPAEAAPVAEPGPEGTDVKRRRKHRRHAGEFDETFAGKRELSPALVRGLIGSVAMLALILGGAILWAVLGDRTPDAPQPVAAAEPEPEPAFASAEDQAAASRTLAATVIENELQPVVKGFLEAESVEEMSEFILHPEESVPRMKEHYTDGLTAPGLSDVIWQADNHRQGEWATITVETGEFVSRPIWLKNDDGWKVDWESWAGWSPVGWEEMKREQPTEPRKMRVLVSPVDYYNFAFADELEWTSYLLESPERDDALYGYVPKNGELDRQLESIDKAPRRPFVLKLRYPEEDRRDNQVIIEEVISDSWLDAAGES